MAQTYEQWKKSYESLDDSQKKLYADTIKSKGADYIGNQYLSQYNSASASSTPKNTSSNTVTETYRGQVSDGTSGMNSMSQSAAQDNSRNFQVGTGDVAVMQRLNQTQQQLQNTKQQVDETAQKFASTWNNLTAAQQMAALASNKNLGSYVQSKGLTTKQEETPATTAQTSTPKKTTTAAQTPKQAEWDYQDNSQARMNQIADNLDRYRQTNPELFDDGTAFYNFFIKDKGRSQDQIDFLWDYFNNIQKYGKYDNMSPSAIGNGIAHGNIPEDYLNYLKANDPAKYQEVMNYKQESEDTIKYESYLQSTAELAGIEGWESEKAESIQYGEWNGIWLDEDNNRVDDRREHYATEEEQGYQKQIADLNATNLDIDNTVKHTYDDLVERYPGASKATLMAMAQDMNADLLREKENNLVELTRLQGYVGYMQAERQEMNQAGADSIAQLQKNLGMYYQYSPAGLSELAQAQYAATNVTLDQADSGTETQKQMALQNVLDGYYAKYGDIIQRSEGQVINDVIAYAKKKGIGLAQALQENFVQPLQQKPGFQQLSNVQSDPYVVKVGDVAYRYKPETDSFELIGGTGTTTSSTLGGGTTTGELYGFTNYTPITTEKKEGTLDNFVNSHPLNSDGGQCGSFVNDYLQSLGYDRLYTDPIDKKKAVTNSDTATVGSVAVMDSKKYPQYGHTAIVTAVDGDKVKLLESNWGGDEKVHERWVNNSEILGYFDPSKQTVSPSTTNQNNKYGNKVNWNDDGYSNNLVNEYKAYLADPGYETKSDLDYKLSSFGMSFEDFAEQASNYARTGMKAEEVGSASSALEAAIKLYEYVNGDKSGGLIWQDSAQTGPMDRLLSWVGAAGSKANDARGYYDTLISRLTLDKLIETKKQGATYGAMSEGEWKLLGSAATDLNWTSSGTKFNNNLEDLIYSLYTVVEQGDGSLPTNFNNSSAAKMLFQGEESGRRNPYKEDNTPGDYDNFGQRPSRIS